MPEVQPEAALATPVEDRYLAGTGRMDLLQVAPNDGADAGARLAIRLLQDAAERGALEPWDVDVIAVIDGFLDQLRQRIHVPGQGAAPLIRGQAPVPAVIQAPAVGAS